MIVTSWVRLGLYEVDFGGVFGGRARYVEGVMPVLDGLVMVMEGRPVDGGNGGGEDDSGELEKHWCDDGADVSIFLSEEAKERLRSDEGLWKYS